MDSAKLPISGPCPIDLDAIGFDRSRKESHCSHCVQSVHILSNMTREDARAFLKEHAGQKLCVSYRRDATGKVLFKEPAPTNVVSLTRVRASGRKVAARRSGLAAAGIAFAAAMAACTPHSDGESDLAGKMMVVEPSDDVKPVEKEPCDTTKVEKDKPVALAGMAVIPEPQDEIEVQVEGEMEILEPVDVEPAPSKTHG